MIFDISDVKEIILLLVLILASSFALYLPILGISKNNNNILKYCVPLSWSFEIIIGYLFYTFGQVKNFPIFYLIFLLCLNSWAILKYGPYVKEIFQNIKNHHRIRSCVLFLLILIPIFYAYFYDPMHNISPIQRDAFGHITFLRDLANTGRLRLAFYAPGFHLLLFPAFNLVNTVDLYRFSGPIIGVVQVLSIYSMFRDKFKKPATGYLLLLLFALPVYNQLTIQIIGFFPSALTFLFFASFISLILDEHSRNNLLILSVLFFALALTVPYFLVQFIPAVFLGVMILYFSKGRIFGKGYTIYFFKVLVITLVSLIIAFGHVYLQTRISKTNAFPKIPAAVNGVSTDNYKLAQPDLVQSTGSVSISSLKKNTFLNNYISPLLATGLETIKIKNIRKPDNMLSIGAYLWLAAGMILLFFSIKKKNRVLFVLSVFTIMYGISVQTGVMEMSYYRGRSGWYFLLLSIIGVAFVFDQLYDKKFKFLLYSVTPILVASCFLSPPEYYRAYYPEIFNIVYNIYKQDKKQNTIFYTDVLNETQEKFSLISPNLATVSLDDFLQKKTNDNISSFVIIEKKVIELDPTLSAGAISTDKNFSRYNQSEEIIKNQRLKSISDVKNTDKFKSEYKLYWQDDNIEIYQAIRK